MNDVEEKGLIDEVRRLVRHMNLFNEGTMDYKLLSPSRNLVLRSDSERTVIKSYEDMERWTGEYESLNIFHKINGERNETYQRIANSNETYIGLPHIEHTLPKIHFFTPIEGQLLYEKMRNGTATIEDKLLAVTQIARIQQEGKNYRGKNHKDQLVLEDVVRSKTNGGRTSYFVNRIENVFLKQLMRYGGPNIPERIQDGMINDWEDLVAQNLVLTHYKGFNGYYYDGNPRNHILTSGDKKIVSFDFEDRLIAPSILSLASLLSFGLDNDAKDYLEQQETHFKFLDRYLLETSFSDALRLNIIDKAQRIHDYRKERDASYNSDLSGKNSDEFFRFLSIYDDKGRGRKRREDFLLAWPYALLDKNSAWIGYKARYRAVSELLINQGEIKFENGDNARQNAIEQKQHLENIISILHVLKNGTKIDNYLRHAAQRLYHQFQELADNSYFSLK